MGSIAAQPWLCSDTAINSSGTQPGLSNGELMSWKQWTDELKLMTIYNSLHPTAYVDRMYTVSQKNKALQYCP